MPEEAVISQPWPGVSRIHQEGPAIVAGGTKQARGSLSETSQALVANSPRTLL